MATFLVYCPLFCVTDVTHVTRKWEVAKKVATWFFGTPTFPWNCNEKSKWPFFVKFIN
nr:MAG TPA: hypothetical protein [Caudoviricetes sp.]